MDLEPVLTAVVAIANWRVLICFAVSGLLSFGLSKLNWLSVPQLIVTALLGLALGVAWQESVAWRHALRGNVKPIPTTALTAALTSVLVGVTWGALSSASIESVVAGAFILALSLFTWHRYFVVLKKLVFRQRGIACVALTSACYLISAVVVNAL
jgi:hypothetical protein